MLFTFSAATVVEVPETAYGHIAMTEVEKVATEQTQGLDSTESIVRSYFRDLPVMIEIARCESNFRHKLSDGSILSGRVDPADTGVMQINKRYHQARADAMDLNLEDVYQNMEYARLLYEAQGVQPWSASSTCWDKSLAANF